MSIPGVSSQISWLHGRSTVTPLDGQWCLSHAHASSSPGGWISSIPVLFFTPLYFFSRVLGNKQWTQHNILAQMCNQNFNFSLILLFYSIQYKIKRDRSNWKMGTESNSTPSTVSVSTPTTSPSAKRSRDPEDEVYVDNLHSHKRYLSEVRSCFSIFNLPLFFLGSVLWDFCNFVVNVTYLIRVCLDSLFFLKKKRKSFMKICMRSISQMIKKI